MLTPKQEKTVLRCIEIYIGDYSPEKQYAASLLLKMILKDKQYRKLMGIIREDLGFKVNDRNDAGVIRWKRNVKKKGMCEICGSKERLVAHHIIPWEYSVKGRTDLKNGQCLCAECHVMVHDAEAYTDHMMGR